MLVLRKRYNALIAFEHSLAWRKSATPSTTHTTRDAVSVNAVQK